MAWPPEHDGSLDDIGIDDKFMKELAASLQPGNSALFACPQGHADKVVAEISKFGGKVLASLKSEDEAKLRPPWTRPSQPPRNATKPEAMGITHHAMGITHHAMGLTHPPPCTPQAITRPPPLYSGGAQGGFFF